MIPYEVRMEDLRKLNRLFPQLSLDLTLLQADKNLDKQLTMARRVYIRLLDKAVDEYSEAREMVVTKCSYPMEKSTRKLIESLSGSLIHVRDTFEHMEEKIRKDEIQNFEPIMLKVTDDQAGIHIGNHKLKFSDLTKMIKKLHTIGETNHNI
ncbi:MAG: hypothetical protein GY786_01750 [Proteobacteria bacterium]|nr:hypothetical protein [Pseudomonadota bacterium]